VLRRNLAAGDRKSLAGPGRCRTGRETEVARLEALGARRIDIGQGEVSWVVMADPEGNEFDVLRALTC
jgi:Glyoxalase-like domain